MPFVALEDVGTTRRASLSGRRRLQAWERTGGTCVVCDLRIDGVRDRWIVEHMRALELGGADDLQNMGPAHEACGREKTRDDHARTAKAKRQKIRHLGAAVVARPFPGSRASAFKRKVNGTLVPREHPNHLRAAIELDARHGGETASKRKPYGVDTSAKPTDRLCIQPAEPGKWNKAKTADQMENQAKTRKREKIDRPQRDETASDEILPAIPSHLDFLFSERPLLPGEDVEHYENLLRSIVQQVKPVDVIEAIWVKDIVDLIWEARRLRGWRRQILLQAQLSATEALIRPALQNRDPMGLNPLMENSVDTLAAGWVAGSESEKVSVEELLQERGLTAQSITAHGFLLNLPSIERVDRLASNADQRRDALLREIERKRESFAQVVRTAAADVLDVEHAESL